MGTLTALMKHVAMVLKIQLTFSKMVAFTIKYHNVNNSIKKEYAFSNKSFCN